VTPSSSEPASRSPIRSSSPIRSCSRWLPRLVASRRVAQRHRGGPDEDARAVAAAAGDRALPGPAAQHLAGQLDGLAQVLDLEAEREDGPADKMLFLGGHAEQLLRVGVGVQQVVQPVGDDDGRLDLIKNCLRGQVGGVPGVSPAGYGHLITSPAARPRGNHRRRGSPPGDEDMRGDIT
jgi:hypothetical protein